MTTPIRDIDGDTIEVKAYAEHHRTNSPFVSVSIQTADGDADMAVHLTPAAVRKLMRDLGDAIKDEPTDDDDDDESEGEEALLCPNCGEEYEGLLYKDMCESCVHNARRSGWEG